MTDVHKASDQASFTEASVREGHSLLSIQMWQNVCRRLAVLGEDTESIVNVMLSMADENGVSPLALCDQLAKQGIKKLDATALEILVNIANGEYESDHDEDYDDKPVPATQPMTPPPDEAECVRGPEPKRSAKRKLFVDLTAEEEQLDDF